MHGDERLPVVFGSLRGKPRRHIWRGDEVRVGGFGLNRYRERRNTHA